MARRATPLVAMLLLALSAPLGVVAQDVPTVVRCVTVAGDSPAGGWDESSLEDAVAAGAAEITAVASTEACAGVVAEPGADGDLGAPLPIEVLDSYFAKPIESIVEYIIVLRNPNSDRWAPGMTIRTDLLDQDGELVGSGSDTLSLLPGQTGAVSGVIVDAEGTIRLDVVLGSDLVFRSNYPTDILGQVEITDVSTAGDGHDVVTSGIVQGLPDDVFGVGVSATYRDKSGDLIGTGSAYLSGPVSDRMPFETHGWTDGEVAETEVFYEVVV